MEITGEQYARIKDSLQVQRGNVSLSTLQLGNAVLYVAEHGCKWRGRPMQFGNWHTIYTRRNRWSKAGVLDRIFEKLQTEQIVRIPIEAFARFHLSQGAPGRHRRAQKNGPQSIGKSRGGWNTKIHRVAAEARTAVAFSLSPGKAHDAPAGRKLLQSLRPMPGSLSLLMDRAYEGNETRQLTRPLAMVPVVPPKHTRLNPWRLDRTLHKKRNEIERLFRRLKSYRCIFTRFEKLDVLFLGFLSHSFSHLLRRHLSVNTP